MLDFLKDWALGVCFAALAAAVISAVSPKGSLQKALKVVTALVVICAIVLPFAKNGMNINFELPQSVFSDSEEAQELESVVYYQLTAQYADETVGRAQELLRENGINDCEITVLTDINDSGGIFIKKADVIIPAGAEVDDRIVSGLYEIFGEEAVTQLSFK